jgi:hypothetical protein
MGGPLSPVLSNIFMEFLEERHLAGIYEIKYWVRYVDDVFALLPQDINIDDVLLKLNNWNETIKFTYEKEINNKLPFLDIDVLRINNRPKFKVFRKPTNSGSYVHWLSGHHISVKRSACLSAYLRAFRICSPEYLDEEIKYVFDCYRKLGYPNAFLKYSMKKAMKIYYTKERVEFKKSGLISLPFNPSVSTVKFLPKVKIVRSYNNKIKNFGFTPHNTLKSSACVYTIPCSGCEKVYIGESDNLERRVSQHVRSLDVDDMNSALTNHRFTHNHFINPRSATELLPIKGVEKRRMAEKFYISNIPNFNTRGDKNSLLVDQLLKSFNVFPLNN